MGNQLAAIFLIVITGGFLSGPVPTLAAWNPEDPAVEASIERGLSSLRKYDFSFRPVSGLVAYTLLVGGDAPESPAVQKALDVILQKFHQNDKIYQPLQHHLYEAGIDAMALEKADRVKYRQHLDQIINYIIREQRMHGGWFYPGPPTDRGDTSITQYALLGLWAGERAGIVIPNEVLAKAAQWHTSTQQTDGGFCYHPGGMPNQTASTGTMSAAGSGSLGVIDLILFGARIHQEEKSEPRLKFGILEPVHPDTPQQAGGPPPRQIRSAIQSSLKQGKAWMNLHFETDAVAEHNGFNYYYYYTLERAATVNNWDQLGKYDWYERGVEVLLPLQAAEGHWPEAYSRKQDSPSGTCFALLFLLRSTQKLIPVRTTAPPLGEGLLAGGRGLPEDLSQVEFRNGRVATDQPLGDLDRLLSELSNASVEEVMSPGEEPLKVDLSQPEQLIGQMDILNELIKHKDPRVRQVAAWALGRSDHWQGTSALIDALKDTDLDVAIEARLALCWMARKPNGWGHPSDPRISESGEAVTPTPAEIQDWQTQVHRDWKAWYLKQRPYELRDDFEDPLQRSFRK